MNLYRRFSNRRGAHCTVGGTAGSWVGWVLALGGGLLAWGAQLPEETRAFEVVAKQFQDGLFEMADRDATAFAAQYPQSEKLAELFLLQAQARLKLKQFEGAYTVLADKTGVAGPLADEYRFWQAQILVEQGDLAGGADGFARFLAEFLQSGRRAEAIYAEAYTRLRLGDRARVMALLREPGTPFQSIAAERPADDWVVRGWLLLAEVLLQANQPGRAEEALGRIPAPLAQAELDWQRHFLFARAKLAGGRVPEAFAHTTNLWTGPTNRVSRELLAEASQLQGDILERLGRTDEALAAYERNLGNTVPQSKRRQALQRLIELNLKQNRTRETVQRLELFLTQNPQDQALDLVRLTLGELQLKDYHARRAAPTLRPENALELTNLLQQARSQFELIVTNYPQSPLLGYAQLQRGWCFWETGTNRVADAQAAFRAAAEQLPRSADQAVARFKWGDCQFLRRDFVGALSNYWFVATNYSGVSGLADTLPRQALYQVVRAAIEANDEPVAASAMSQLLAVDPQGELADRSFLLMGQALSRLGKTQAARAVYAELARRFTNSALLPEVRLALARTYEREQDLPAALAEYAAWQAAFGSRTNLAPTLLAQASFELARLSYQARSDTNALQLLSDYVLRFPAHSNAPLAQYLAGEYHWNQGDFAQAELSFLSPILVQNTNPALAELGYRARLMAGRAAIARQSYRNARDHFDWLITNGPLHLANSPVPVALVAEAYLSRGDTFTLERADGTTNALAVYGQAINAFTKITEHFPTNERAPLAWGRLGECHLQLATQDPRRYDLAAEAFLKVIDTGADVATRSRAEFLLALVRQRQGQLRPQADQGPLLDQALQHYLRVAYGKNLRNGEPPDPYWVKRAGFEAADLARSLQRWDVALGLYRRLQTELPALSAQLERRIQEVEQHRAAQPNRDG
ncbi:MAG: tetratricopeptide repeat protein [Verrucomicrobia bacterium]|nr:tetratricopeptide repeat protein [Verrucomicrobiota bacterium]